MADKLDWLNKHLVLVRYVSLKDVMEKEGYKIRPDLEELFTGMTGAEDMVFKFAGLERYKCAAELMAYIAHRRAAVWWGYRCVLSLTEELRINPAEERDIADIGASLEPEVPEWAKVEPPQPSPEDLAGMEAQLAQMEADYIKMRASLNQEVLQFIEEGIDVAFQEFKSVHGMTPMDLLKKIGARMAEDPRPIDPNSPIFTETAKLKAQLQQVQKDTVETIKSVIPPKMPEHQKKMRGAALDAVYRWVAAPDAQNSQKCLDTGNECPDTPAGLLCLSAFWAYGDLMPLGEQTVATPPGLAANGLSQTLLLCALHPGGTRKLKERYEEYFRLGVEVLTGGDNWEASLANGKAPHREEVVSDQWSVVSGRGEGKEGPVKDGASGESSGTPAGTGPGTQSPIPDPQSVYKRWKPGESS